MTRRRSIATVLGSTALVVVGLGAFVLWPRGTTEITEKDAVAAYRESKRSTTASTADTQRSAPTPGVYTYAAEGREEVKLGPLPSQNRTLPTTVTAVAVDAGNGCFDWTVNLFAEHTEDTRWCTRPVLELDRHTKHQTVGALTPTFRMACDPGALLSTATGRAADAPVPITCTLDVGGGPVSVNTTIDGTATSMGTESVDVGGTRVDATKIAVHFPVTGTVDGTWDETTWWGPDHLPVRVERVLDLAGPATFRETSTLQLTSLNPTG